nr:glycosyltransferase [Pacificimonas pallii]
MDLLISSLRRGGAERMCTVLANQFADMGYAVRVIVMDSEIGPMRTDLSSKVTVMSLGVKRARYAIPSLYRFLCRDAADQILVFNHQILAILIPLRRLLRRKPRFILRNISTLSQQFSAEKSVWHGAVVHAFARGAIPKADHVIAQSHGMASDLIKNYAVDPEKISIIHNAVAPQIWQRREEFQEKEEGFRISFVGRLEPVKDVSLLLDAFADVKAKLPTASLSIYGDGSERSALAKKAKALDLEDAVKFFGQVTDVVGCYIAADVTALTSIYEGFPNCLIESIAFGTPIVSVDCKSGPEEIIENGQNGYLVRSRRPRDIAEALLKAAESDWDRKSIRVSASRFSPEQVAKAYEAAIFS